MGAKSLADAKEKPLNKCEECSREFQTLAALKSHTMAKHPEKYKQMQNNESVVKEGKKTALVPPTSRVSKRLQHKKSTDKEVVTEGKSSKEIVTKSPNVGAQGKRKTMFECPKCFQLFPVYFSANKHIQKRHCVDEDGNPVSPDALDLIKPIAKDMPSAKKMPSTDDTLSSGNTDNGTYCCLACKETFQNVTSFDEHVEGNHDDQINVFILESMMEFFNWKSIVEAKQRVKYLMLSNTTQKQYYQCNYVSTQNSADVTHLCPSVMIVREFSKGIHIRYHKEHHEHICESIDDYSNTSINKTQSIKENNDAFDELLTSEEDLFAKLKDLFKIIVQKASVLKQPQLKHLYKSAIEMRLYLDSLKSKNKPTSTPKRNISNINTKKIETDNKSISDDENREETEEDTISHSMTDDQITKVLETPRISARLKRKSEGPSTPEVKKIKVDKPSTQQTGLKENNAQNKTENGSDRLESRRPIIASPSFNDSYKQFIEGASPQAEKPKLTSVKKPKKEVVKTKIGQFSPKKSPTVKADTENVDTNKKRKGPSKQNTSLENLNLEEMEYEVVEQENDCNILILKI